MDMSTQQAALLLSTESRQKKNIGALQIQQKSQNVNTNRESVVVSLIGTCMYGFPHVTRNHLT
jgi:hypothetical protein